MKVEYDSNNSGGNWWLDDEDWYALEKAGWKIKWYKDDSLYNRKGRTRWLGALASCASKEGVHLREAVDEWESIVGKASTEVGCPCCGPPHHFTEYDDEGNSVSSGPEVDYSCSW